MLRLKNHVMKTTVEIDHLTEYLDVKVYTLQNDFIKVKIMSYGGIVMELWVPDKDKNMVDVTLGFKKPSDYVSTTYLNKCPYFGAIIGRYANRIKNGRFRVVEHEYQVQQNEGVNQLHGGTRGFDKVIWKDEIIEYFGTQALRLSYVSEDGDQGFPGQLMTEVVYYIDNDNGLGIDYRASTTRTTPVNLTFHGYFNLSGEGHGNILDHELMINAHEITEVNDNLIPTGNIVHVDKTPFDFTKPHLIGSRIKDLRHGYDHNYVIFPYGDAPHLIAAVRSPKTGIKMTVYTTQPGVQLYTGYHLDATLVGKSGHHYGSYSGFCLETQHFPDSPNNPHFPRTLLEPDEIYHQSTVYRFDTV